jgi:broad specificity phosphatase PhoE/ribonuclease HI
MSTRVVIEADGGSRGNPGPAGYGAVVMDAATGAVLAERAEGLGITTNNVAEYSGLIAGLEAAREVGATEVDVRMDSKLVVEQMSGRWKIKHPGLQPLALRAAELAREFDTVRYAWIPREANKHADRLANEAMDDQAGITRDGANKGKAPGPERPAEEIPAPAWLGATGTPTKLVLLRHGQTELSVDRRYSGRGNPGLTDLGRRQAGAAAARLADRPAPAAIISSPLARSWDTAQAVASATGAELTGHDGLIETDFGDWEGLTFTEAARRDPELHRAWLSDPTVPAPGGESFHQVHQRVRRTRDDLITKYGGATILIVSHVTPIKSILRMALDAGPSLLYRLHLDLASLSVAEFYPDGNASVRLVNDTAHLH